MRARLAPSGTSPDTSRNRRAIGSTGFDRLLLMSCPLGADHFREHGIAQFPPAKQLRTLSNLHDFSRLADRDALTAQFVCDPIRQIGEVERPSLRLDSFAKLRFLIQSELVRLTEVAVANDMRQGIRKRLSEDMQ